MALHIIHLDQLSPTVSDSYAQMAAILGALVPGDSYILLDSVFDPVDRIPRARISGELSHFRVVLDDAFHASLSKVLFTQGDGLPAAVLPGVEYAGVISALAVGMYTLDVEAKQLGFAIQKWGKITVDLGGGSIEYWITDCLVIQADAETESSLGMAIQTHRIRR
jgi:hypothetical protein